jgi:uridine kinase
MDSSQKKSFLVVIAGGSASGKSTFSDALMQILSALLRVERLSTDGYFYSMDKLPRFFSPTTNQDMPDCNHPDSIDCARLVADIDARRGANDCPDVLIVEGLMVLHHADIRTRADLRLFVDLEGEVRALRRLVRNLGHAYDPIIDHDAASIANYYLESAWVGHEKYVEPSRVHADWIMRGDGDFNRTAVLVADLIRARV